MEYEIRVWKNADKMPDIEPQKNDNRLTAMIQKTTDKVRAIKNLNRFSSDKAANPDILIDKNAGGEGVIQSIDISYVTKEVDTVVDNRTRKKKVRLIKMNIKGNLYLPLKEDGLLEDAASLIGKQKDENKIRDTVLLSQWANVLPAKDAVDHYYRGIVVSILTKAGDFRVITAKKVHVESYTEDYSEGEFGTFELKLIQSADANNKCKVDGLGYEEIPIIKSVADKVKKAADVVATVGTAVATAGAVGVAVTETVEKFTGETAATKWVKYGMGTATTTGGLANSTSNLMKNPKDVKTWTDETQNITKNVTDNIKDAKSKSEQDVPLSYLEGLYLGGVTETADGYEKYINMSDSEKRETLLAVKERLALEATSLAKIKADPLLYAKYLKMSENDKIAELKKYATN